jgi:hypothetical protein
MTGFELYLAKASAFFGRIAHKCIIDAIKKWKETTDRKRQEENAAVLSEFEAAKGVATKIDQRITASS